VKVKDSFAGMTGTSVGSMYRLAVDVRNVTNTPGQYGLLFGFQGGSAYDFYSFRIGPSGDYFVYYYAGSGQNPIQETLLTSGWSAGIRPGSQTNHLEVFHRSEVIDLFANGHRLTTLASDRTGGSLGMMAKSGSHANLDVRYDNFEVYALPPDCYGSMTGSSPANTPISNPAKFMLK
jgi:hypothetical protein